MGNWISFWFLFITLSVSALLFNGVLGYHKGFKQDSRISVLDERLSVPEALFFDRSLRKSVFLRHLNKRIKRHEIGDDGSGEVRPVLDIDQPIYPTLFINDIYDLFHSVVTGFKCMGKVDAPGCRMDLFSILLNKLDRSFINEEPDKIEHTSYEISQIRQVLALCEVHSASHVTEIKPLRRLYLEKNIQILKDFSIEAKRDVKKLQGFIDEAEESLRINSEYIEDSAIKIADNQEFNPKTKFGYESISEASKSYVDHMVTVRDDLVSFCEAVDLAIINGIPRIHKYSFYNSFIILRNFVRANIAFVERNGIFLNILNDDGLKDD